MSRLQGELYLLSWFPFSEDNIITAKGNNFLVNELMLLAFKFSNSAFMDKENTSDW
jgi:hypothetical protein